MTGAAGGERSRLLRALALSRRFHLYLARCASPRAADQLVAALSDELPRLGRAEVRLVRLEPYSGRTKDTPLTDGELAARVLLPLLDPPDELRGAIHLVDASRVRYADTGAWARLFSLWNEKRNVLDSYRGEVVVMLPAALAPEFAAAAPDVWSIRSGEYVIDEDTSARGAGLEAPAQGSISFVGVARVTLPSPTATAAGSSRARSERTLLLVRAVSPLALFGGDLLIRPWVEDLRSALAAREISDPTGHEQSGVEELAPPIAARRKLRLADWKLATRCFDEAKALYSELIARADGDDDAELTPRAVSGLAVALVGRGRMAEAAAYGERALSLVGFDLRGNRPGPRRALPASVRALQANALVQWCLGHLEQADLLDQALAGLHGRSIEGERSHVLRLIERGQMAKAREGVFELLRPRPASPSEATILVDLGVVAPTDPLQIIEHPERRAGRPIARILAADLELLAGEHDGALRHLERASADLERASSDELAFYLGQDASLIDRLGVALALVEIARGNEERASRLLARSRHAQAPSPTELDPGGSFRADAFHAVTSGLLAMVRGDLEGASAGFELARGFIADWGDLGLDRRSHLRAQLLVELLRTALHPDGDQAAATARSLAGQAEALLGETAEDHMSRVLAVAAHSELARCLASVGGGDARAVAQRATALARPLGNLGVPAWEELLHAAERSP